MKRNCPVCYSPRSVPVREMSFAQGDFQKVVVCRDCGLGYACDSTLADYGEHSSYVFPESIGAGATPEDRSRLKGFVEIFSKIVLTRDASILDIGCAQGGLLEELRAAGYKNLHGLDPSQTCVDIARGKDFKVSLGSLPHWNGNVFDVVILNHVLEHMWDVNGALAGAHRLIRPEGIIWIEVPDAERYADLVYCPFLDFNHEHINHFSSGVLAYTLAQNNFQVRTTGKRTFTLPGGKYPAVYAVGQPLIPEKPLLHNSLNRYAIESEELLRRMVMGVRESLLGKPCCVWGAGEFSETFIPALLDVGVVIEQVVDRNFFKHETTLCGIRVTAPPPRPELPVVVASVLNVGSILRDLEKLPNEVITL